MVVMGGKGIDRWCTKAKDLGKGGNGVGVEHKVFKVSRAGVWLYVTTKGQCVWDVKR